MPPRLTAHRGRLAMRRASGLSIHQRVRLHDERIEALAELAAIDQQLEDLALRRRELLGRLGTLRDVLFPVVPWCHGRRPPVHHQPPLPAAPPDALILRGRELRSTCLALLRTYGTTQLTELHALLHRHGYLVGGARPVQVLADALAYEVELGNVVRTARGTYAPRPAPPTRSRHGRDDLGPDPPRYPEPGHDPHACLGRPAVDPAIRADPGAWAPPPPPRHGGAGSTSHRTSAAAGGAGDGCFFPEEDFPEPFREYARLVGLIHPDGAGVGSTGGGPDSGARSDAHRRPARASDEGDDPP